MNHEQLRVSDGKADNFQGNALSVIPEKQHSISAPAACRSRLDEREAAVLDNVACLCSCEMPCFVAEVVKRISIATGFCHTLSTMRPFLSPPISLASR